MIQPKHAAALAALLACATTGAARPAEATDLSAVWERFQARHEAAETAEIVWEKTFIRSKDAYIGDPDIEPPRRDGSIPPSECRLVLAGLNRERLEVPTLSTSDGDQDLPLRSIRTYDGALNWRLHGQGPGQRGQGSVAPRDRIFGRGSVHLLPLDLALRPMRAAAFGPTPAEWRLLPEPAIVAGRPCLVMEKVPPADRSAGRRYRAYLDPDRGYLPLQFQFGGSDETSPQTIIEMRYERRDEPTWVPSYWKSVAYDQNGRFIEQSINNLVSLNLGVPVKDELFRIDFPPGTFVRDQRRQPTVSFVVGEDGGWVPHRQFEARTTAGEARTWPWIAALGAAALAAALLVRRRRSTAA